jgi:hypothetical protein
MPQLSAGALVRPVRLKAPESESLGGQTHLFLPAPIRIYQKLDFHTLRVPSRSTVASSNGHHVRSLACKKPHRFLGEINLCPFESKHSLFVERVVATFVVSCMVGPLKSESLCARAIRK